MARMNPLLGRLHPYPFERLRVLTADIVPSTQFRPIALGIGEPKHSTPTLIEDAIRASLQGLSVYPATAGTPALRALRAGAFFAAGGFFAATGFFTTAGFLAAAGFFTAALAAFGAGAAGAASSCASAARRCSMMAQ